MEVLKKGDPALDFATIDINNNTFRLSQYQGKKLLLCFMRFASCPLCSVRFVQLLQRWPKLKEQGLEVVVIFESSPEYIKKYVSNKHKIPFPVIADPEGELYKLYGVKTSVTGMFLGMFRVFTIFKGMLAAKFRMGKMDGSMTRIPADFLLNPFHKIADFHYGSDIGDHIPFPRVEAFVQGGRAPLKTQPAPQ